MNSDTIVYLKPSTLVEPLFNQWFAWSHLIPPAAASMYVLNSHVKILESFLANPHAHVAALKNRAMMSGPFIHYDPGRADEIRALLEKTRKEQGHLIDFARGIKHLNEMLIAEAQGSSLEPFYERVPNELKGYVELIYDLNNFPRIRFIEGLLYDSPYYNTSAQTVAVSLISNDHRPFAINTPRLRSEDALHLNLAFADKRLDELFEMKEVPRPYGDIRDRLAITDKEQCLFSSFFTEEPPPLVAAYSDNSIRIRYYGHACLLVESKRVSILSDPLISYKYPFQEVRYTSADLPKRIDYVLITHYHQDHLVFEMLLQLRHRIGTVIVPRSGGDNLIDPSLKLLLKAIGFKNVVEIDEMETIEIDGGSITGIPFLGEHADLNVRAKIAYLIDIEGKCILCMADSNNVEPRLYEHIARSAKQVDCVFIGMECDGAPLSWVYGPFLPKPLTRKLDQSRRLNGSDFTRASNIVSRLDAKQVYVYAMGQEPWLSFLMGLQYTEDSRPIIESNKLVQWCRERGRVSERLSGCKDIFL